MSKSDPAKVTLPYPPELKPIRMDTAEIKKLADEWARMSALVPMPPWSESRDAASQLRDMVSTYGKDAVIEAVAEWLKVAP